MTRFTLVPRGPYSLAASVAFLEGFAPAAYEASETPDEPHELRLAFAADGGEQVAGVVVRAEGETVAGEITGTAAPAVVQAQIARILSLDVDGGGFPAVGVRDPVVGRLQERYPGLRPVCFCSPYEAAAWAVISGRIRITQAARIKARMARELGQVVEIGSRPEYAFPAPSRLLELEAFPGLSDRKVGWLRALGSAAAAGKLDAATLRAMPAEEALARLKELPGIGDFSAQLVLLRGAGAPDCLAANEPRLARAVARAYGLDHPSTADLERIADGWRPYRTWVTFLLRVQLEEETGEIAG